VVPPLDVQTASEEYFARVRRAALMLTGDPWDADDLAQETFLVLARGRNRFEGRSAPFTFLYGVLLNLDRRRRRRAGLLRRKLRVLWGGNEPRSEPTTPAAETALEVAEWKRSLWSVVAELPDGQRQCLVLRFSERLRYDEIAAAMKCPLGTVKSRIFHGLAALRERMEDNLEALQIPKHAWEDIQDAV